MNRRVLTAVRVAAGAAAIAIAIPLSGCIAAQIPESGPSPQSTTPIETPMNTPSEDPTPNDSPSPDPVETEVVTSSTLSFAEGTEIAPGTITQWGDGLIADSGWKLTSPDNGQGSWGYTSTDGACKVTFWQGAVYDMAESDDKSASDLVLASLLKTDKATVGTKAQTGAFSFTMTGQGKTDQRYVMGKEQGRSWVIAARGFAKTKSAVYVIVDCTSDAAPTVAPGVWKKSAVIVG